MTMIDPYPELVNDTGITTDAKILATLGSPVQGLTADGATIVLLLFRANFSGERLQITVLNDRGAPSVSAEDGALAEIAVTDSGVLAALKSFEFKSEPLTVSAPKGMEEPIAFALFRAPDQFSRGPQDHDQASRGISFQIQSLDLPCFTFIWPGAR